MDDPRAAELVSVGLHTGVGEYKNRSMLVSHPDGHKNTEFFRDIFGAHFDIVPDAAANDPAAARLSGDLVDFLEARYAGRGIPIMTADMEIGTGEKIATSPILKRMDQFDARWEMKYMGRMSPRTMRNLREDWYPDNKRGWRDSAMETADAFALCLREYMARRRA
jgi:hypothetical protein